MNKAFAHSHPDQVTQVEIAEGVDHDVTVALRSAAASQGLQKLDNMTCIGEYAQDHVSSRRDLLLVLRELNSTETPKCLGQFSVDGAKFDWSAQQVPYKWICSGIDNDCRSWTANLNANASNYLRPGDDVWKYEGISDTWRPEMALWNPEIGGVSRTVDYCLS